MKSKKPQKVGSVDDLELEGREWILREVDRDPSSGMPTRFHHWLVDRFRQPLTPTQSQTWFLAFCKDLGVRAIVRDDTFVFVQKGA